MTNHQETDSQSFDRHGWAQGAATVFRAFFFQYYPDFFSFANALLTDRRSATNITTEALFLLWKKRQDVDNLVNARAFLYTTIRNHCLNYLKYLRQEPDAGEYRADRQRWPPIPEKIREEVLRYAEGFDAPPQVARER